VIIACKIGAQYVREINEPYKTGKELWEFFGKEAGMTGRSSVTQALLYPQLYYLSVFTKIYCPRQASYVGTNNNRL